LVLCGRNAVQVSLPDRSSIELNQLADRLKPLGTVTANRFLVRFQIDDFVITAFADGRAIINGTEDLAVAKRLYTQYIGS
jgi:adenylyltransferase/sulfurtransferase